MPVLSFLRRHRVLCLVLALHALAFALLDTVISPHPDYIDHWMQSRVLAFGYYEHPPMIAWVLRALTAVVGDSEPALEGIAIFLNLAILAGMYAIGANVFGVRAAAFGLVAADTTPFFIGGTPLVHIDQPLLLFWLAALWALLRYQRTGRARWLLLTGILAGLGALSKYTMVLFYLGALVFIVAVPGRRRELLNPYVYAAGVLSLLVFSPVLMWNAQHAWVSILFQLRKGAGGAAVFPGKHLAEFTLGYVFLFSPVMVAAGAAWFWRRWRSGGLDGGKAGSGAYGGSLGRVRLRDDASTLLLAMWITPVVFFSLAMIPGSFPDPQYVNEAFLSFFILLGRELEQRWADRRKAVLWVYGGSAAITLALLAAFAAQTYHPFLRIGPSADPTRQIVGWDETGRQVSDLLREKGLSQPRYVISFYYPLASQFSLHLPSRPYTYSLQREARNEWADKTRIGPDNGIVVCEGDECAWMRDLMPKRLGHKIAEVGTVQTVLWGTPRRTVSVYRLLP
jgi:4-amino-4-deoxy-L-arabinose transferase-like glycosyltransferase